MTPFPDEHLAPLYLGQNILTMRIDELLIHMALTFSRPLDALQRVLTAWLSPMITHRLNAARPFLAHIVTHRGRSDNGRKSGQRQHNFVQKQGVNGLPTSQLSIAT